MLGSGFRVLRLGFRGNCKPVKPQPCVRWEHVQRCSATTGWTEITAICGSPTSETGGFEFKLDTMYEGVQCKDLSGAPPINLVGAVAKAGRMCKHRATRLIFLYTTILEYPSH